MEITALHGTPWHKKKKKKKIKKKKLKKKKIKLLGTNRNFTN
ncbi:hypothetical protein [Bacillus subtilis]